MARKHAQLGSEIDELPEGIRDRTPKVKGRKSCNVCTDIGPRATVQYCLRRVARVSEAPLANANAVCSFVKGLGASDREHFLALHVDVRGRVVDIDKVATGSQVGVEVHPREVFRGAMLSGANSLILVHNHPSGASNPSKQDLELTRRLREVGGLVGIPVLDHVIVGGSACTSLSGSGLMGNYEFLPQQTPRKRDR